MFRRFRYALALGLVATIALTSVSTASAGGKAVFSASLVGLPTGGLVLDGLTGGGVPWSINEGRVTITEDGNLHLAVQGLVVTQTGENPVATGRAVVVCAGAAVASTDLVPFSRPQGNAQIDAHVDLPSPCLDLAVFFTNSNNRWFAVTGL